MLRGFSISYRASSLQEQRPRAHQPSVLGAEQAAGKRDERKNKQEHPARASGCWARCWLCGGRIIFWGLMELEARARYGAARR